MVALEELGWGKVGKDTFHLYIGLSLRGGQYPCDDHGDRFKLMLCYSMISLSTVESQVVGSR